MPASAAVLVLILIAGQSGTYTPDTAPAELKPAVERADQAFARLRTAVFAELSQALAEGGALNAVSVCHQAATDVTEEVRRTEGFALGRTSHRLRNRNNAPPSWATAHVARGAEIPMSEVRPLVVDLGDRVGVMRPMPTMGLCLNCHGPEAQIAPDVQETITALYPGDKATGFREGDLRGWMWAEVPKAAPAEPR